jgi:hypothetical protein
MSLKTNVTVPEGSTVMQAFSHRTVATTARGPACDYVRQT